MKVCNKCILNDRYSAVNFDEHGTCSLCNEQKAFMPLGEEKLRALLEDAKNKKSKYDALVPLSGGKDSMYILHLAVNVYKLKVLTMTFDNGFFSQIALDNIRKAVETAKVDHVFCKPDAEVQRKIYRAMFLASGDFCGACDIGTKVNIIKVAKDYSIPIILYGTSPLENDSFVPDSIQDFARFKYILNESKTLERKEVDQFLIYPNLNLFSLSYYKHTGKFAKEVRPLFYLENPSDKEMGEIISREFGWLEDTSKEYSKHFDCIAEPLTNYMRHKIYGYERRICQYSNMVRRNEISREKALALYSADNIESLPANYQKVLDYLQITREELHAVEKTPPLKYENRTSKADKVFAGLMKLKSAISNR